MQLDSPFQLQEHLKALYHSYTRPNGSSLIHPITRDVAVSLAEPPEGVERSLWLYELCRFLTMKVNNLIVAFFAEDPPCSAQTCPEMRASEWQYLCAVHDPPKSCCAIDYCCHTLDWATNILTSPKYFPSRLTLGSESGGGHSTSMRHLTNIFRRLYRIFAHAWFQHRDVFRQVEGHDGLYVFFKTVCDVYNLIPEDNYTIPPEATAETSRDPDATPVAPPADEGRRFSILRREPSEVQPAQQQQQQQQPPSTNLDAPSTVSTGTSTRRHKHSPSTGSRVTPIAEGVEEELEKVEEKPEPPEQQPETEDRSEPTTQAAETPEPSAEPSTAISETPAQPEPEDSTTTTPQTPETPEPMSSEETTTTSSSSSASSTFIALDSPEQDVDPNHHHQQQQPDTDDQRSEGAETDTESILTIKPDD